MANHIKVSKTKQKQNTTCNH